MKRLSGLLLATLVIVACKDSLVISDKCFILPPIHYAPVDTSIANGDTLRMHITVDTSSCYPNIQATPIRWVTNDTTIASIDSLSGLLTARKAGTTEVAVHALQQYGGATVTVTGP